MSATDSRIEEMKGKDLQNWNKIYGVESKDVFQKAKNFVEADMAKQIGFYPYFYPLDSNEGTVAYAEGKEIIMLGSNNYLGLTTHPEVREAAQNAIAEYGTSLTGSRFLNGTHKTHILLEEELAEFFGKDAGLVFATGYQANIGALTGILSQNDVVVLDKADHGSIFDGALVSKAQILRFNHNDAKDLDRVLQEVGSEKGKLVVVDGVFSMEGDLAKLPEVIEVCRKNGARLLVDDAHGLGIVGKGGRGTSSHFGLVDETDLIVGTFSKSLASIGGFVVGDAKIVDFIKHFGRSMVFSASLPPSNVASARKALEILKREPERVTRVQENGVYMREGLKSLGFNVGATETPIIPVIIGDEFQTLTMWRKLLDKGVYINSVITPAVPKGHGTLRTSVTSEHTKEHLDKALDIFAAVKKESGL